MVQQWPYINPKHTKMKRCCIISTNNLTTRVTHGLMPWNHVVPYCPMVRQLVWLVKKTFGRVDYSRWCHVEHKYDATCQIFWLSCWPMVKLTTYEIDHMRLCHMEHQRWHMSWPFLWPSWLVVMLAFCQIDRLKCWHEAYHFDCYVDDSQIGILPIWLYRMVTCVRWQWCISLYIVTVILIGNPTNIWAIWLGA
jgi:hypothetical protein